MNILVKLVKLIQQYPNDTDLGRAIREWYNKKFE
jgi:hypothetical protein